MATGRSLEEMITRTIRAEVGRVLGHALGPMRTKVEETVTRAVERATAPVQVQIERLVNDAARKAVDLALDALRPGSRR